MNKYRTATQWGVYDVLVEQGQIVGVENIAEDPAPSPLGQALVDGIQHSTRVMTTTIALETSKGNLALALGLGVMLLTLALSINAAALVISDTARRRYG